VYVDLWSLATLVATSVGFGTVAGMIGLSAVLVYCKRKADQTAARAEVSK
jgi:hypothetical protein